jgi:GAF domain-containing protein
MRRTTGKKVKTAYSREGRFQDILEATHLLSSCAIPERVVETVLSHLCERLGKRARCAFLEGEDLTLRFWAGDHTVPLGGLKVSRESIVWEAVKNGVAMNLTDPHQTNGYTHTLREPAKIKAIIPLGYIDPLTQQRKNLGVLIVDAGQNGAPISAEDFEYLQVIGELISAIMGRAELVEQLMTSCRRQEAILMETAHNFRNRIAVIGGFSRRIARLAHGTELADKATHLHEEVTALEAHLAKFEKYMSLKT